MLALQIVEAEARRLDPAYRALDVAQLGRGQLDRVIRRRLEVRDPPGARVVDRRPVYRRQRLIVLETPVRLDGIHGSLLPQDPATVLSAFPPP
jgi:hypothetical protein